MVVILFLKEGNHGRWGLFKPLCTGSSMIPSFQILSSVCRGKITFPMYLADRSRQLDTHRSHCAGLPGKLLLSFLLSSFLLLGKQKRWPEPPKPHQTMSDLECAKDDGGMPSGKIWKRNDQGATIPILNHRTLHFFILREKSASFTFPLLYDLWATKCNS